MNVSHPRTAPALMALGAFFLVANDTFVKLYASHLPTNQIIVFRSLATLACCILILWYRGTPLPNLRNRDLLIRTGFTIANVYAFVIALVSLLFSGGLYRPHQYSICGTFGSDRFRRAPYFWKTGGCYNRNVRRGHHAVC